MAKTTINTIDEYLATVPSESRKVLQSLRHEIQAIIPDAEEGFSYGMPAFLYEGKGVAGFAAAKEHYSYFPMSGSIVDQFKDELKDFSTSKGTIRFTADKPLSKELLQKLIAARVKEINAKKGY